ncbi:AlpA family phage regulatory protein [Cupriavidus sp. CV2]|uniref:helix-turn-helix transcriptional regulator n=1 Tax=Cupriavidus ulmosensis TaxID=3065913 RepID=UPI00296AEB48|nr:AlpA family phage regulatory protein [Cupriavidus sp. CV2]MDW3684013.1 AlpA family phage regulatory protein [Cupriavidus sp. CV2]
MKPIYLDLPGVAEALSLSPRTIHNLVVAGGFPKQRLLTGRRVAWLTREVEAWAESRPVSDLLPPPSSKPTNR